MIKKIFMLCVLLISVCGGGSQDALWARPLKIGGLELKTPMDRSVETVDTKLDHLEKELRELRTLSNKERQKKDAKSANKPISDLVDYVTGWVKEAFALVLESFSFIHDLPEIFLWVKNALSHQQNYYEVGLFLNEFVVSFSSCLFFFFLFLQILRWLTPQPEKNKLKMALRFFGYIIGYSLLPYFVYLVLSFLEPRAHWLNLGLLCSMGIVAIWSLIHLSRLVLEPYRPHRRLFQWPDHYCIVIHQLIRRFSFLGVGGFFTAQALLMNGIPLHLYNALLDSIAFVIMVSVIIWIFNHQKSYSQLFIRLLHKQKVPVTFLRRLVCNVWHVPLILLLMVGYFEFCAFATSAQFFIIGLILSTFVILILAYLEDKVVFVRQQILMRLAQHYWPRLVPDLEASADRIDAMVGLVFYGIAAISLLEIWGFEIVSWLTSDATQLLMHRLLVILVIVGVVLAVLRLGNFLFDHYGGMVTSRQDHTGARMVTVISILRNTLRVGVWVPAVLLILAELGMDITPLVASLGIVSFGLSLGAQNLVKDVITGLFMIIEDTLAVGETVTIDSVSGKVEAWTIRSVALRDDESGALHTIPFSSITRISNFNRNYSYAAIALTLPYQQNLDRALEVAYQAFDELLQDKKIRPLIIGQLEVRGIDKFSELGVLLKLRIKAVPGQNGAVKRAFNYLIKNHFQMNQIPFATAQNLALALEPA